MMQRVQCTKGEGNLSAGVRGWGQGGSKAASRPWVWPSECQPHGARTQLLWASVLTHILEESCPMLLKWFWDQVTLTTCLTQTSWLRSLLFPGGESAALSLRGQRLGRCCWGLFHPQLSPSLTACRWQTFKGAPSVLPRLPHSACPHGGTVVPEEDFRQAATQTPMAPRGSDHNKTAR